MSVLIFTEHSEDSIKKSSLESISFGVALAAKLNTEAISLVIGNTNAELSSLGEFGVKKVFHTNNAGVNLSDTKQLTKIICDEAIKHNAAVIIFSNTITAKGIAPRVSIRLKSGLATGVVGLPDLTNGFTVKKNVFSGKAFSEISILTEKKVLTLNPNCFEIQKTGGLAEVISIQADISESSIKVTSVSKIEGEIPLAEAEKVVSAGRGLKGPENWGMVEELAKLLGAATACSRPVSDSDWRPHHEHVGQTGLSIAPNLYIAIGISGAIQHLAGVNRSKTIVVINKDPEAPFFKAADYGIIGDAFEVVPKIISAIKELKSAG
jgi:electron transfer flavoprotein alpha subunit